MRPLVSQTIFICEAKNGWSAASRVGPASPPSIASTMEAAFSGFTFS